MARIDLQDLSKTYVGARGVGIRGVQGVNLGVGEGELLVLMGPSGSGKTTTLRLIAGLEEPTSGAIRIDGRLANARPAHERDVAMVFQRDALYPHMTVYENLSFGLRLRKEGRGEIERRVRGAAEMLGVSELLDRLPRELSGGQRQRVALGRAIVRQPVAFLFDEPLSQLDGPLRTQLRREIAELQRRLGVTTVYVTHDQTEAMVLGDRIAVMHGGVVQQVSAPAELYERPANLIVAGMIGLPPMNLVPATVMPGAVEIELGKHDGRRGPARMCLAEEQSARLRRVGASELVLGIRPEDLRVVVGTAAGGVDWLARVEWVEDLGSEFIVRLSVEDLPMVMRVSGRGALPMGERLGIQVDRRACHFFDSTTGRRID